MLRGLPIGCFFLSAIAPLNICRHGTVRPEWGYTKRKLDFTKDNSCSFNRNRNIFSPFRFGLKRNRTGQILIPVPAKPEPEIDFCRNSGQICRNSTENVVEKSRENLKSVYFGLNMDFKHES